MVEIADIKDKDSLKNWLEDQPRDVSVWIASRAAARVLPLGWDPVLIQDWARDHNVTALPVLRRLLISSAAYFGPKKDFRSAANAAADAESAYAYATATTSDSAQAFAAAEAAASAFISASDAAYADSAAVAAHAVAIAADAADSATYDTDAARAAVWTAIKTDAECVSDGPIPDALPLWPAGSGPFADNWARIKAEVAEASDAADWQFWVDWYDAQLAGRTMLSDPAQTRKMLEKIALIDPATWDAGPETVNREIRKIWDSYKGNMAGSGAPADPEPVSEDAKSAMKQRVAVNRDALVMASAGVLDQLGTFKEQVRGMNHLEPELREEVLAFIDEFTGKLSELIGELPATGTAVDDDQAGRLVLWLREYRGLLRHKLAYYASSENMADVTVPTGIILGATGIGAMLGMPVAGSVVGGLIVNQMKPGQAARELTKPSSKDADAP